jgi:hypothetical protein
MVEGTIKKQVRAYSHFQLISAFTYLIREGRFCSKKHGKPIKSNSVRVSLDCVAQAFKLAD